VQGVPLPETDAVCRPGIRTPPEHQDLQSDHEEEQRCRGVGKIDYGCVQPLLQGENDHRPWPGAKGLMELLLDLKTLPINLQVFLGKIILTLDIESEPVNRCHYVCNEFKIFNKMR